MTLLACSIKEMIGHSTPSDVLYEDFDLWSRVFPELKRARSVTQRNKQTVLEHTANVLDRTEKRNRVIILSAIAHDLGKVNTRTIDKDGKIHFFGHQHDSASIVRTRLRDIDFDENITKAVTRVVRNHMYDIKDLRSEASIRKFIAEVGEKNLDAWFVVRTADSFAYLPEEAIIPAERYHDTIIVPFKQRIDKFLASSPEPYDYKDIMPKT